MRQECQKSQSEPEFFFFGAQPSLSDVLAYDQETQEQKEECLASEMK